MRINLLKRLESSVDSFRITLEKFVESTKNTIESIERFEKTGTSTIAEGIQFSEDMDEEDGDWLDDEFSIGGKVKINLEDLNTSGWKQDLEHDYGIAKNLLEEMRRITPEYDSKLNDLKNVIKIK